MCSIWQNQVCPWSIWNGCGRWNRSGAWKQAAKKTQKKRYFWETGKELKQECSEFRNRKEKMDVEARIYLPEKPLENVWGYGEVTVERLFTFQVRVLKHRKENGEEVSFVSFPRRKVQGRWEDAVHPSQELRERIAEVVNQEIRKEIIKDLELPEIVVQSMSLFPVQPKKTVSIVGIATVEVCGLTIKGVTVKQGQDGLFCNLPQYYSEKEGYRDVIRPTSKRIREAISETVLQEYQVQKQRVEMI
mgnify:CR=1 FL=1